MLSASGSPRNTSSHSLSEDDDISSVIATRWTGANSVRDLPPSNPSQNRSFLFSWSSHSKSQHSKSAETNHPTDTKKLNSHCGEVDREAIRSKLAVAKSNPAPVQTGTSKAQQTDIAGSVTRGAKRSSARSRSMSRSENEVDERSLPRRRHRSTSTRPSRSSARRSKSFDSSNSNRNVNEKPKSSTSRPARVSSAGGDRKSPNRRRKTTHGHTRLQDGSKARRRTQEQKVKTMTNAPENISTEPIPRRRLRRAASDQESPAGLVKNADIKEQSRRISRKERSSAHKKTKTRSIRGLENSTKEDHTRRGPHKRVSRGKEKSLRMSRSERIPSGSEARSRLRRTRSSSQSRHARQTQPLANDPVSLAQLQQLERHHRDRRHQDPYSHLVTGSLTSDPGKGEQEEEVQVEDADINKNCTPAKKEEERNRKSPKRTGSGLLGMRFLFGSDRSLGSKQREAKDEGSLLDVPPPKTLNSDTETYQCATADLNDSFSDLRMNPSPWAASA